MADSESKKIRENSDWSSSSSENMADSPNAQSNFWTQANALLRKNLTFQASSSSAFFFFFLRFFFLPRMKYFSCIKYWSLFSRIDSIFCSISMVTSLVNMNLTEMNLNVVKLKFLSSLGTIDSTSFGNPILWVEIHCFRW